MKNLVFAIFNLQAFSSVFAQASQDCLYCKRADTTAGFLYDFGYCDDTAIGGDKKCVSDPGNYINPGSQCISGFKPGW